MPRKTPASSVRRSPGTLRGAESEVRTPALAGKSKLENAERRVFAMLTERHRYIQRQNGGARRHRHRAKARGALRMKRQQGRQIRPPPDRPGDRQKNVFRKPGGAEAPCRALRRSQVRGQTPRPPRAARRAQVWVATHRGAAGGGVQEASSRPTRTPHRRKASEAAMSPKRTRVCRMPPASSPPGTRKSVMLVAAVVRCVCAGV